MREVSTDPREAAGLALLEELAADEARLFARRAWQLHDSAALSERLEGADAVERFLVMDVAGTARVGQLAAGTLLADARRLVEDLPGLLELAGAGTVFVPQLRAVLRHTRHVRADVAAEVDRRVCALLRPDPDAWTGARLHRRVEALLLQVEAELGVQATSQRQDDARASRRVSVRPEPDGMGSLWALLPAEQLRAFALGLDELTRRQSRADREAGVVRTADQRRADLLAMLPALALHALDGTAPGPGCGHPRVVLEVQVPVLTLLDRSDAPGHLRGHGPLAAHHVRTLLPDAWLRQVLVDRVTGEPVHVGSRLVPPGAAGRRRSDPPVPPRGRAERRHADRRRRHDPGTARREAGWTSDAPPGPAASPAEAAGPGLPDDPRPVDLERLSCLVPREALVVEDAPESRYRPSDGLARLVRAREPLCAGPGCATASAASDLDHRRPWPLGPTTADNLVPHSRRCHRAKTVSWSTERSTDGTVTWTSPTGRRYAVPALWDRPPAPRPAGPSTPSPCRDRPGDAAGR